MISEDLKRKRDELAGKYSIKERKYNHTRVMEPMIKYAKGDFVAGFNAAEPLIREDERKRILGLLRAKIKRG